MAMAKVRRISLVERDVRERLGVTAIELLLEGARVLSEGDWMRGVHGDSFYGSTMLTIALDRAAGQVREPCDATTARRVASFLSTDGRIGQRLRELAAQEANRLAGTPIDKLHVDGGIRTQESTIYVDIDFDGAAQYRSALP